MSWCFGGSYTVNEGGSLPKCQKDHSFKAIIITMLSVLLVLVLVYCLFVLVNASHPHGTVSAPVQAKSEGNKIIKIIEHSTNFPSESITTEVGSLEESSTWKRESAADDEDTHITEIQVTEPYTASDRNWADVNMNPTKKADQISYDTEDATQTVLITNGITEKGNEDEFRSDHTTTIRSDQIIASTVNIRDEFGEEISTIHEMADVINATTRPTYMATHSGSTDTDFSSIGLEHLTTSTIAEIPTTATTRSPIDQKNATIVTTANWTESSTEYHLMDNDIITNERTISIENTKLIKSHSKKVCEGYQCKEKVADILQQINHSIDSCEDFYQFACGRSQSKDIFSAKVKLLAKTLDQPANNLQEKHFQRFIQSCEQYHNGFEYGFEDKLEQVLSNNIRSNNLTVLLASLMVRQSTPFFEVKFDFISSSEGYGLQILPPSDFYNTAILHDWSIESGMKRYCMSMESSSHNGSNIKTAYSMYKNCVEKAATGKLKDFIFLTSRNKEKFVKGAEEVDTFPVNMNQISDIDIQEALTNQRYIKTDITSLNKIYRSIDWGVFFNIMFHNKFDRSLPIYLYMQDSYFDRVMTDLKNRLAKNEEDVLHKVKQFYQFQFYEGLVAQKPNADTFCLEQAQDLMPEISETIFASQLDLSPAIDGVKTVFEIIKNKFHGFLSEVIIGMEKGSKEYLKKQLTNLTISFFANNWNTGKDDLSLAGDDYISYLLVSLEARRCLKDQPIKHNLTFSQYEYPAVIPNSQTVFVPNNFLYRIVTDGKNPAYITEIYLRFYLSRVIALYLDRAAEQIGTTYWSEFKEGFYGYFETTEGTLNWNEQQIVYNEDPTKWQKLVNASLSDLLSDNLALQIAFEGFSSYAGVVGLPWISDDFTLQQQFFLLIAQDFCQPLSLMEFTQILYDSPTMPHIFRVNTMMSNSKDFEETFKCARGSGMNPEEKLEINTFKPQENFGIISK